MLNQQDALGVESYAQKSNIEDPLVIHRTHVLTSLTMENYSNVLITDTT